MKFIIGKKLEMAQRFAPNGSVVPVTLVSAGPCVVTQIRSREKDGYAAVQVGYLPRHRLTKSERGHLNGLEPFGTLREFRIEADNLSRGQVIQATVFTPGDIVEVEGVSKGHGFQGVVKRHGFHGHPASHGHKDQLRMPGSIGSKRQGPVAPGKRMAGRMGNDQVTVKNLEIIEVNVEKNILVIKGALPGARGSVVLISGPGEMKFETPVAEVAVEPAVKADEPVIKAEPQNV